MSASSRCQERRERIFEPTFVGQHIEEASVLEYRAHRVAIVGNVDIVQVGRNRAELVYKHLPKVLPGKIRHGRKAHAAGLDFLHQHQHGSLGRIATHDEVDAVIPDQFAMVVGSGEATKDQRHIRVVFLNELGDLNASLRQPMQRDPKSGRRKAANLFFNIKSSIVQHSCGEVDDLDPVAETLQVASDTGESNRVHVKNGT